MPGTSLPVPANIEPIVKAIEVGAIVAAAYSGIFEARKKRMDIVGIFVVAFITAFGGGTLRDVLLDRRPLFWVEHSGYVLLVLGLTLVSAPLTRWLKDVVNERMLVVADALGLGLFAVSGTAIAQALNVPMIIASMMGVITGIFGGVLRDVICNAVPMVLKDRSPYAICAFGGSWLYLLMMRLEMPQVVALLAGAMLVTGSRLIAWRFNVRLGG
jgi:uncharacterized membrane protein YeiH